MTIEWARWCRHPQYLVGALGVEREYARFRAPLRLYAITDDRFAPPRAVEALGVLYPNARVEAEKDSTKRNQRGPHRPLRLLSRAVPR